MSAVETLATSLSTAWRETGRIEIIGAVLAIAYLVLAIRESILCWVAAFVSSCLYAWVLFEARLYMEAALNVFYAAMAVYGYVQWDPHAKSAALTVHRWPWRRHAEALAVIFILAAVSAFFLRRYTPAAWPLLDSMVAWSSVFATFLVARKVYENWYWFLVIDSVSLCLYATRGLYLTVLLFALYIVLIFVGLRTWRRSLDAAHAA